MPLELQGKTVVKCENCEERYTYEPEDFGWEVVERHDRPMDQERHYTGHLEFDCGNCDNSDISITYDGWEYPNMRIEHEENNIDNATFIQESEIIPVE